MAVRSRAGEDLGTMTVQAFQEYLFGEVAKFGRVQ